MDGHILRLLFARLGPHLAALLGSFGPHVDLFFVRSCMLRYPFIQWYWPVSWYIL